MRLRIVLFLLSLLLLPTIALGADSYLNGPQDFRKIGNSNRQAEAWAMCAATYDFLSEVVRKDAPATAESMKELNNGAKLAVAMSYLGPRLRADMSPKEFTSLWETAKTLMVTLPDTMMTQIQSDLELHGGTEVIKRLIKTMGICRNKDNMQTQQGYIDMARELRSTGLLKAPSVTK